MKHVLVIEDDNQQRQLFMTVLEKNGYQVTQARDGVEGSAQLHQQPFDLVITDIFMPTKDGLEIIQELRQQFKDIKVIAITGGIPGKNIASNVLDAAKSFGADLALEKPIRMQQLLSDVGDLLSNGTIH